MKAQCGKHGCSELLCGCDVECLEDNDYINDALRAKNKWINELLITGKGQ